MNLDNTPQPATIGTTSTTFNSPGQGEAPVRTFDPFADHRGPTLAVLASMITNFNGDPLELPTFLQNAENALNLAEDHQETTLTGIIFSKISGNVRNQINITGITSFEVLKDKLKQIYTSTDSLPYLVQKLDTSKQKPNESVKEFFVRIEKINEKILANIKASSTITTHAQFLSGKLSYANELALLRFTNFCKPEVTSILRMKKPSTIHEALALAKEEETFQNNLIQLSKNQNATQNKYCKHCKKTNHTTQQCRFKPSQSHIQPYNSSYNNNYNSRPTKECSYCHFKGHTIEECRKKKYNERLNPNPRVAQTNNKSLNLNQLGSNEAPSSSSPLMHEASQHSMEMY